MGREPWSNRVMVEDCKEVSIFSEEVKRLIRDNPGVTLLTISIEDENAAKIHIIVTTTYK